MKNRLKIAAPSFAFGAIFGAAFWYLASPLWIDRVVEETLAGGAVIATGNFVDADAAHKGSGVATVVELESGLFEVQLSEFEVTNGPDLELWLAVHPNPDDKWDVLEGGWVSLGLLKGNIGDQSYTVPPSVDISQYGSVVVWCEQFGVLFSPASLNAPDA